MSPASLVLLCSLISITFGIDRTQFTNFRASESHDGYLSFSTPLTFPLSLKWTNKSTSCTFSNGILSFALTDETFYCLTNEIWDLTKSTDAYIEAYDINTGDAIFRTFIDVNTSSKLNRSAFDGIVTVPPNYLAILDDNKGDLFILNGTNGDIVYNVSVDDECKKYTDIVCLESGLTSSPKYKSIFIHYTKNEVQYEYEGTLFKFDVAANASTVINAPEALIPNPQIPTICNDDVIITTNLFGNASAFEIGDDGTLTNIWNYSMTNNFGAIYFNPPLCIPSSDGGFNVLINSILDSDFESWELLNGKTGELIKQIEWTQDATGIPGINTDKGIMIRTTLETNKIIAYDIGDVNGNWTEIYNINGEEYFDIMIVDENIFLCSQTSVDVYDISDGKKIFSWPYPDTVGLTRMAAGLDSNGKPVILIVAVVDFNPPQQTILYALQ